MSVEQRIRADTGQRDKQSRILSAGNYFFNSMQRNKANPGTQKIEGRFECSPYLTLDRGGGPVTILRVVIIFRLLQIMLHCFIYLVKCSHFLVLCGR